MKNKIKRRFSRKKFWQYSRLGKWWRKHKYAILRILLFWIWIPAICYEKIQEQRYKSIKYSDPLTKKYLDKILPDLVVQYEEDPNLLLFSEADDMGGIRLMSALTSAFIYNKYKTQYLYFKKFRQDVKDYILNEYEIDGYNKMKLFNSADWNAAREKFDWGSTPYDDNYVQGVVFTIINEEGDGK